MALTPIVSRQSSSASSRREVHAMLADCIVPFVGGWLMNAYFDAHPARDSVSVPVTRRHHPPHH